MSNRVEIELMPYDLVVASIDLADIIRATNALLQLVLSNPSIVTSSEHSMMQRNSNGCGGGGGVNFFSFTRTPNEISCIIEYSSFTSPTFPRDLFSTSPDIWRAIQVYPGEQGTSDLAQTIHSISREFAAAGISIFQLSTFEADFTLFRQKDVQKALACLQKFTNILNPGEWLLENRLLALRPPSIHSMITVETSNTTATTTNISVSSSESIISSGGVPHYFRQFHEDMLICSLDRSTFDHCLKPVLYQMFIHPLHMPNSRTLFSVTIVDGCPSFIMSETVICEQFQNVMFNLGAGRWRLIEISNESDSGLGFEETGIVANFTQPLSERKINCFYLSTFMFDYVMVNRERFDESLQLLNKTQR